METLKGKIRDVKVKHDSFNLCFYITITVYTSE